MQVQRLSLPGCEVHLRDMVSRRDVLRSCAAALVPVIAERMPRAIQSRASRVVVIGAGAFGGWTALHLAKRGASVTLIDAWGAGNVRASSGGETRVIRGAYNGERTYIRMVRRAFDLWHEYERAWQRSILHPTGALWMFERDDDAYLRRSAPIMREENLTAEELTHDAAAKRFPQIRFDGLRHIWWEREAGFLLARESCELVRQECVRLGVEYVTAQARGGPLTGGTMSHVPLGDGTRRSGDIYVFACGPWLGTLFPDVVGARVRATKQDVMYFGPPPGDRTFDVGSLPVWVNFGERLIYGIPGNERRGFKIADDTLGRDVDPTTFERTLDSESVSRARDLLQRRFPAMARAPLVHSEICQYESTPDGHYLMDWHPAATNVLLLGGGSGHGFKMGPAIGEMAAKVVLDREAPPSMFSYKRLGERN